MLNAPLFYWRPMPRSIRHHMLVALPGSPPDIDRGWCRSPRQLALGSVGVYIKDKKLLIGYVKRKWKTMEKLTETLRQSCRILLSDCSDSTSAPPWWDVPRQPSAFAPLCKLFPHSPDLPHTSCLHTNLKKKSNFKFINIYHIIQRLSFRIIRN